MESVVKKSADRNSWLIAAIEMLRERGAEGIKIVPMAKKLGLTSGSFYWHFKDVQDLLDAILVYWEEQLTLHIVEDAQAFSGPPEERIYNLMRQVIEEDAAVPDHAISVWAKSDPKVKQTFERTLDMRYQFAKWMFEEAGFPEKEAQIRGRLMVSYLMGESSGKLKSEPEWESTLRRHWELMVRH